MIDFFGLTGYTTGMNISHTKGVVKRAVSLPKDLDAKLIGLVSSGGGTYSGLVREALEVYLKQKEDVEMEAAYVKYYADPKNRKADEKSAREMWAGSQRTWAERERRGEA